jgi:putative toxin-antitoxin system antitoxin component (TIGR02293 family)
MALTRTEGETGRVAEILGGYRVFRRKTWSVKDMQEVLRKGLPFASFETVLRVVEVRSKELASILGVAPRTLARRKTDRHLSPIESDRLYRIAYIAQMACETLGSLPKARAWLHAANSALGGQSPISRLDTEIGEREVEDLLNRINYGIYS